ncbi:MAG: hypothetical protein WD512_04180, partial [Candidatus Paceibacterota bacterium]
MPVFVEASLSPQLSGVAKVEIFNNTLIRGYGTFPHPNILAFAGILALLLLYSKRLGRQISILIYIVVVGVSGFVDHYILTSIQALSITVLTAMQLKYSKSIQFPKLFMS